MFVDDTEEKLIYGPILVRLTPARFRDRLAERPELGAEDVREQALTGLAEAQLGFGHMLLDGYGVARDPEAAFRWFALAAKQGNVDAWNMLGRCYELGWGVTPDLRIAAHWYGQAARKSHNWAQFNAAALMLRVDGERADLRRAISLLVASARARNPKAMNLIGQFREKGWTRARNKKAAARWFRWAAQGGCFRGQFHHARYLLGEGKVAEAVRWLRSSLLQSPLDFAQEVGQLLRRHPQERVRRVAEELLTARMESKV